MANPTKMSLKNLMEFLSTPDGTPPNVDQTSQPGGAVHWENLTGMPDVIKNVSDGTTSLLIDWKGDLSSAPVPPEINWAYRNTTTKTSYLYTQSGWVIIAKDGIDGEDGVEGSEGIGIPGAPGESATITIGTVTTGLPGTSAQVTNTGTASAAIFNFTIPRGADGTIGSDGADGVPIVWKGELATPPSSPQTNWAYRNTTDKKSYIYSDGSWQTMCVDGTALPSGTPTSAPVISSPLAWSFSTTSFSTYLITAYNLPTSFGATGLPLGLGINASTGLISGTVSTPGNYSIVISATNVLGTDTKTLVTSVAGQSEISVYSIESSTPTSVGMTPSLPLNMRNSSNTSGTTLIFSDVYGNVNPATNALSALFLAEFLRNTSNPLLISSDLYVGDIYDFAYLVGSTTSTAGVYNTSQCTSLSWTPEGFVGVVISARLYREPGSSHMLTPNIKVVCHAPTPYTHSTGISVITSNFSTSYYYDSMVIGASLSYSGQNINFNFLAEERYALANGQGEQVAPVLSVTQHTSALPASYFSENRRAVAAVLGSTSILNINPHTLSAWNCQTV